MFMLQYLQAFYQLKTDDRLIGRYADFCLKTIRQTKASARRYPPSSIEIAVSLSTNISSWCGRTPPLIDIIIVYRR